MIPDRYFELDVVQLFSDPHPDRVVRFEPSEETHDTFETFEDEARWAAEWAKQELDRQGEQAKSKWWNVWRVETVKGNQATVTTHSLVATYRDDRQWTIRTKRVEQ